MKNIIKISAAGAGKTYDICRTALELVKIEGKRSLIVTYTNRGYNAIENEIRKQNNGVLHPQVIIKTWYTFLLTDAIKPYQRYINTGEDINTLKGIDFTQIYGKINYHPKGSKDRYITKSENVLANQASELACYLDNISNGKIVERLREIYSNIFFDEIQDLTGYDIDLIKLLLDSNIDITCCGDNKQATFSTHNARKNKKKTGKNIWVFFSGLNNVEIEKNLSSRRFNQEICDFANEIFPIGDPITTIMNVKTGHDGVFLIEEKDAEKYYNIFRPQVLRYDSRTNTRGFRAVNFGECKGETYDRVLIFPNNPLREFLFESKGLGSPEKYYVGVTRAKYSVTIVIDSLVESINRFQRDYSIEGINLLKYISNNL